MTTFDQEWTGLKQGAAARMQLAGVGGETGGDSESRGLRATKQAWCAASEAVDGMRDGLGKAMKELEAGQTGTGAHGKVGGLESAAAQCDVYASWHAYAEAVRRRCGELSEKLEKAGNHHYKNDEAIAAAFRRTRTAVHTSRTPDGQASDDSRPTAR